MTEHAAFVGDISTVGTVSVLTLLAFSARANVRTVGIGASVLIAVCSGLAIQAAAGWMPSAQESLITYHFAMMAVAGAGTVLYGLRRDQAAAAFVAVNFAVSAVSVGLVFRPGAFLNLELLTFAVVLVICAVAAVGHLRLERAGSSLAYEVRREVLKVWVWAMRGAAVVAVCGTHLLIAWPRWTVAGIFVVFAAGLPTVIALGGLSFRLMRHHPSALAWAACLPPMRRAVFLVLVRIAVASAAASSLIVLPYAWEAPTWTAAALLPAGVLCLIASGNAMASLRWIVIVEALSRYGGRRAVAAGTARSELRTLAASDPVYRLLPGISNDRGDGICG